MAKRPSGDSLDPRILRPEPMPYACPIGYDPEDLDILKRRLAIIDGNSLDPTGGRIGRIEGEIKTMREEMTYSNRLLITTLLASLGTMVMTIIGFVIVVKR